jgi:hypothetical protein
MYMFTAEESRWGSAVKWWNEKINEIEGSRVRSPSPGNLKTCMSSVLVFIEQGPIKK